MRTLQFKLGTAPLSRHEVVHLPRIGELLVLSYPSGGKYTVRIYEIYYGRTYEENIYYGEWS